MLMRAATVVQVLQVLLQMLVVAAIILSFIVCVIACFILLVNTALGSCNFYVAAKATYIRLLFGKMGVFRP